MAALGVVPDLVARAEADPLRDRPVLLRDVRELLLDDGGLVGRLLWSFFFGEGKRKVEVERKKRERAMMSDRELVFFSRRFSSGARASF